MNNSFVCRTKTTGEKMLDFPASLGRRPVTFAQLKRNTTMFRKLKPCCMFFNTKTIGKKKTSFQF